MNKVGPCTILRSMTPSSCLYTTIMWLASILIQFFTVTESNSSLFMNSSIGLDTHVHGMYKNENRNAVSHGDILILGTISYIHTYIHTYIQTYIHTYIHTYIYTYMFYSVKLIKLNFTSLQASCSPFFPFSLLTDFFRVSHVALTFNMSYNRISMDM